jgi:hypothetical protein
MNKFGCENKPNNNRHQQTDTPTMNLDTINETGLRENTSGIPTRNADEFNAVVMAAGSKRSYPLNQPAPVYTPADDDDGMNDGVKYFDTSSLNEPEPTPARASQPVVQVNVAPAPVATSAPTPAAPVSAPQAGSVWESPKRDKEIAPLIAEVKKEYSDFTRFKMDLAAKGLDGSAQRKIVELDRALTAGSVGDIIAHGERLESLRKVTPGMIANANLLVAKRVHSMREKIAVILDKAETHLQSGLADSVSRERAFFAANFMPYEKTSVSKRFEDALAQFPKFREQIVDNPRLHPVLAQPHWSFELPSPLFR